MRSEPVALWMQLTLNGLLVIIGLLTVVLPIVFNIVSTVDKAPWSIPLGQQWQPLTGPTPSTPRDPTTVNAPGQPGQEHEGTTEAVPRDNPPPATKIPSAGGQAPQLPTLAVPPQPSPSPPPGPRICGDALDCVNQLRAQYGVAPLAAHPGLTAFAQECADRGATSGVYSYSVSGPGGFSFWREHIAVGYSTPASFVEAMSSASSWHLAALLDPAYTFMGVAAAGDPSRLWWCQELGG